MFELGIQKNWIDALCARSSVRQYTGAPPSPAPRWYPDFETCAVPPSVFSDLF